MNKEHWVHCLSCGLYWGHVKDGELCCSPDPPVTESESNIQTLLKLTGSHWDQLRYWRNVLIDLD